MDKITVCTVLKQIIGVGLIIFGLFLGLIGACLCITLVGIIPGLFLLVSAAGSMFLGGIVCGLRLREEEIVNE